LRKYPIMPSKSQPGLHASTLGLSFEAGEEHFDGDSGDLRLKCEATVDTVYARTNEKSAKGLKAKRHSGNNGEMPGQLFNVP